MLVRREFSAVRPHPSLVSAHAHAVLAGFVMFLIPGVALWPFLRAEKDDLRYRSGRLAAAYRILTPGTTARVLAAASRAFAGGAWRAPLIVCFSTMWPRIRPVESRLRETKGERF
jgi:hypothetical protein